MELYTCSKCGFKSNPDDFHTKTKCKKCHSEYNKKWAKDNPEKNKKINERRSRKRGHLPISENRDCACFLGVHVAERVLSNVFKDVVRQPHGNPGFDFICNNGKKIDVKSACLYHGTKQEPYWNFMIRKNKIADYFLCLAFDNRDDLNPLHMWLLPAENFNNQVSAAISITKIYKWNEYNLNVDKVSHCCDVLRGHINEKIN